MTLKVNLKDVLEAIEIRIGESNYFYYKKNGEVFMLMDDELRAGEEGPDLDKFPEWQRENIKAAVDIILTYDYIRLPDDYEIDDYSIMEDFCYSIEDEELRKELLYAIRDVLCKMKNISPPAKIQTWINQLKTYQKKAPDLFAEENKNLDSNFEINHYFDILDKIKVEKGWLVDCFYLQDRLGGEPSIIAYPESKKEEYKNMIDKISKNKLDHTSENNDLEETIDNFLNLDNLDDYFIMIAAICINWRRFNDKIRDMLCLSCRCSQCLSGWSRSN